MLLKFTMYILVHMYINAFLYRAKFDYIPYIFTVECITAVRESSDTVEYLICSENNVYVYISQNNSNRSTFVRRCFSDPMFSSGETNVQGQSAGDPSNEAMGDQTWYPLIMRMNKTRRQFALKLIWNKILLVSRGFLYFSVVRSLSREHAVITDQSIPFHTWLFFLFLVFLFWMRSFPPDCPLSFIYFWCINKTKLIIGDV